LSQRKDPFKSIQAFGELKNEDAEFNEYARLAMKTNIPGLHSKMEDVYPGLRILYDAWPQSTVLEFYRGSHVLLAPSKGEGKNLPALEFLSTGGTVIATNWGGHTEWLHTDYAYPLNWSEDPTPRVPGNFNASASVEHMKELMLHTFRNRDEVRRKGYIASSVIPGMCSWDSVVVRLIERLKETGTKGEKVALAFEMANAERGAQDARH
jgi:glycosyltransferase involved in cell wall biosynthesis